MEEKDFLKRELEARAKDEMDARSILETAASEGRDMTPEEEERFDKFVASAERRKGVIDKVTSMAQATEAIDERSRRIITAASGPAATPVVTDAERIKSAILDTFEGRGAAPLTFEMRALETVGSGASMVPVEFSDRFAFYARTLNPTLSVATVLNSNNGETVTLPRLTADPTVYTPGEGTAITASDPTIDAVTLSVTSFKTLTYVSAELAQDNAINLMDIIARSAGRAIGLASGVEFTTGTNGFISKGSNGGTAAGSPYFLMNDIISLFYSAAAPYRAVGSWQVSNAALSKIRKFTDTDGQYLWQPSVQLGQPDLLLGRAVYENPAMATVGSATKAVAFGDFSAYTIKQLPLRVEVSRDYAFNVDNVAVKCVLRTGGTLPDAAAIRYLVSANV